MRPTEELALALILLFTAASAHAKTYHVFVKRVGPNMYKTDKDVYIKTIRCKRASDGEPAVLEYEWASYDNKLTFDNGEVCKVPTDLPMQKRR